MTPKLPDPPARSMYGNLDDLLHAYGLACWKQGMERAAEICDGLADSHQFIRDSRGENIVNNCSDAIRKEIT